MGKKVQCKLHAWNYCCLQPDYNPFELAYLDAKKARILKAKEFMQLFQPSQRGGSKLPKYCGYNLNDCSILKESHKGSHILKALRYYGEILTKELPVLWDE